MNFQFAVHNNTYHVYSLLILTLQELFLRRDNDSENQLRISSTFQMLSGIVIDFFRLWYPLCYG